MAAEPPAATASAVLVPVPEAERVVSRHRAALELIVQQPAGDYQAGQWG